MKTPLPDDAAEIVRRTIAEHRERERNPPKPTRDETCLRCGSAIPSGEPFVAVVRWTSRWTMNDPHFIGRQGGAWHLHHEPAGAICLVCAAPTRTT